MLRAVFAAVTALLLAAFLPVYLLETEPVREKTDYLLIIQQETENETTESPLQISLKTENGVENMPLEEYLTGVVLSEMPASFETEALKAQAVAARTFAMRQLTNSKHDDCDLCADSSCCQAWTGKQAMENKLGASFLQYWEKAEEAVRSTSGQVILFDGKLIDAVYFSCSGGKTEDAVAVWGNDIPYLQSVDSPGEENAGVYSSSVSFTQEQFLQKLRNANPKVKCEGLPAGWFGEAHRTEGGGVASMEIGGIEFAGTALRQIFGLRSTNFTVSVTESGITFTVYGYGHRVGMSQYGANAMAQDGKNYIEILQYYYTGVSIEKHP